MVLCVVFIASFSLLPFGSCVVIALPFNRKFSKRIALVLDVRFMYIRLLFYTFLSHCFSFDQLCLKIKLALDSFFFKTHTPTIPIPKSWCTPLNRCNTQIREKFAFAEIKNECTWFFLSSDKKRWFRPIYSWRSSYSYDLLNFRHFSSHIILLGLRWLFHSWVFTLPLRYSPRFVIFFPSYFILSGSVWVPLDSIPVSIFREMLFFSVCEKFVHLAFVCFVIRFISPLSLCYYDYDCIITNRNVSDFRICQNAIHFRRTNLNGSVIFYHIF